MLAKGFRQLLKEAGAVAESLPASDALALLGRDDVVFLDVRESHERAQGFIPGSVHAPRGFLEFIADPDGPMHDPAISSDKRLIVYCGSGTRSALAARTLSEMGFGKLANLAGGLQAWIQTGGDLEG